MKTGHQLDDPDVSARTGNTCPTEVSEQIVGIRVKLSEPAIRQACCLSEIDSVEHSVGGSEDRISLNLGSFQRKANVEFCDGWSQ